MVKANEVTELFLQVCPDARQELEEHFKDFEGEPPLRYAEISVFAHQIVDSYEKGQTGSFTQIFELVERLIAEGDDDTKGLMIVGLIECIQTIASWRSFGSRVFEPYLGPLSLAGWREIEIVWEGKSSLIDVIRAEAENG